MVAMEFIAIRLESCPELVEVPPIINVASTQSIGPKKDLFFYRDF